MTEDLCMVYVLMLVSITLTVLQGHSGSAKTKLQCWSISTTKLSTSIIKHATTVAIVFYMTFTLKTFIWAWPPWVFWGSKVRKKDKIRLLYYLSWEIITWCVTNNCTTSVCSKQRQLQRRENSVLDKDMDIQSVMSLKRESTLQSIKQQQSIKDASMYVGTIYCLLPDGTEPEVPQPMSWPAQRRTNWKFWAWMMNSEKKNLERGERVFALKLTWKSLWNLTAKVLDWTETLSN